MLGVAFGVGFIVGPSVGGLLGGISLRAPFWGAAILSLANAAYGYFILPESLTPDRRTPFHWSRANPIGAIQLLQSRPRLFALGCAGFLSMLAHDSLPIIAVIYMQYRFQWTELTMGLVLALVGAVSVIVQGGLVGRIVGAIGERRALALGLVCGAIGMIVYATATSGTVFLLGITMTGLYGLASPALQSLMSRRVGPGEQGQLQGAIGSLNGIAAMSAPSLFTWAFALGIRPHVNAPGVPFLVAACFLVAALVVSWIATAPSDARERNSRGVGQSPT